MHAWQSGAHQLGRAAGVAGGALDEVELEDESSGGGDGVRDADVQRSASPLAAGGGRAVLNFAIVVGGLVICITVVVLNQSLQPECLVLRVPFVFRLFNTLFCNPRISTADNRRRPPTVDAVRTRGHRCSLRIVGTQARSTLDFTIDAELPCRKLCSCSPRC